jgi:hypothetical protein
MNADALRCHRTDLHDSHDWITMDDGLKLHRCPGTSELPAPVALAPERAPVEEQPQLVEEVVSDGERLTEVVPERVEGPAPAGDPLTLDEVVTVLAGRSRIPLNAYDAWSCLTCGSRRFEPSACCGRPMVAVRVEIHARDEP